MHTTKRKLDRSRRPLKKFSPIDCMRNKYNIIYKVNINFVFKKIKQTYDIFLIKRKIKREFKDLFKLAKQVEVLGEKAASKIFWDQGQIYFYSANILAQNFHKLKSIATLVKNGLASDAYQIVRPLIESVLDHDYILRNPEKLDLYFKYSGYLDIDRVKRHKKFKNLTDDESVLFEKMKEEWKKDQHLFINKGKIRMAWRDKSLSEIAKETQLANIYSSIYKEANDYSHSNSNLIQVFVKGKNAEQGLLIKAGPTFEKRDILLVLPSSLVLVFHMIMRANWYFKLGLNNEIRTLDKQISKSCINITQ